MTSLNTGMWKTLGIQLAMDTSYLPVYNYAHHRHVSLPKPIAKHVPNELMTEEEWRSLGVKQSQGWEHYMIHSKCMPNI